MIDQDNFLLDQKLIRKYKALYLVMILYRFDEFKSESHFRICKNCGLVLGPRDHFKWSKMLKRSLLMIINDQNRS